MVQARSAARDEAQGTEGRYAHFLELFHLFGEPLLRALALDGVARRVGEEPARCLHGGGGARRLGKNAVHFDVRRVLNVVLDIGALKQNAPSWHGVKYGTFLVRESPATRGTETSAEVLVGPHGRMVSNAGQQQWYEGGHPL